MLPFSSPLLLCNYPAPLFVAWHDQKRRRREGRASEENRREEGEEERRQAHQHCQLDFGTAAPNLATLFTVFT